MDVSAKIAELRELTADPDWDLVDHSPPIPGESWDYVRGALFMLSVLAPEVPQPNDIGPCGDGSIHVTWNISESVHLHVEVWAEEPDPEDLARFCACLRDESLDVTDPSQYTSYNNLIEFASFMRTVFIEERP